jgi:uncharacterized membrane protein YwzB
MVILVFMDRELVLRTMSMNNYVKNRRNPLVSLTFVLTSIHLRFAIANRIFVFARIVIQRNPTIEHTCFLLFCFVYL